MRRCVARVPLPRDPAGLLALSRVVTLFGVVPVEADHLAQLREGRAPHVDTPTRRARRCSIATTNTSSRTEPTARRGLPVGPVRLTERVRGVDRAVAVVVEAVVADRILERRDRDRAARILHVDVAVAVVVETVVAAGRRRALAGIGGARTTGVVEIDVAIAVVVGAVRASGRRSRLPARVAVRAGGRDRRERGARQAAGIDAIDRAVRVERELVAILRPRRVSAFRRRP